MVHVQPAFLSEMILFGEGSIYIIIPFQYATEKGAGIGTVTGIKWSRPKSRENFHQFICGGVKCGVMFSCMNKMINSLDV